MDKAKLEHHIGHLTEHHRDIDKKIKEGYTHYLDDASLGKMKHEKAHIKRQLEEAKEKLHTLNVKN